ncbi:MAG: hypothetical protein ACOX6W_10955 [Lentisphaeria bacterium]
MSASSAAGIVTAGRESLSQLGCLPWPPRLTRSLLLLEARRRDLLGRLAGIAASRPAVPTRRAGLRSAGADGVDAVGTSWDGNL